MSEEDSARIAFLLNHAWSQLEASVRGRLEADVVTDGKLAMFARRRRSGPGTGGTVIRLDTQSWTRSLRLRLSRPFPGLLEPGITRCLYTVCQLAPQVLLPPTCPLAPFPLPVGHGDEGVAQQLQMPSLQQGVTRWRPPLEEVQRTIKL